MVGTPGDLARAVWEELANYFILAEEEALVINLSIGWRDLFSLNALGDLRASVQAVQAAFEVAARESLERQRAIEAADDISFETFMANYFAQS